jgi:hypothetical protein
MSLVKIYGFIVTPDGHGIDNIQVNAEISGSGPPYISDDKFIGYPKVSDTTGQDGKFEVELYTNDSIIPSGSTYNFKIRKVSNSDPVFYESEGNMDRIEYNDIVVSGEDSVNLTDLV